MKLLMKEAFAIILLSLVGNGLAQDDGFQYFERPSEIWNAKVAPVGSGNAVQISPDATIVYVTSANGTLTGLDATDGSVKFSYNPPSVDGAMIGCQSGVSFYDGNDGTFAVYSIIDYLKNGGTKRFSPFGTTNPTPFFYSRVIGVPHPSGRNIWISDGVKGVATGSPHISSDGDYIFLAHNSENSTIGHFTVFSLGKVDGVNAFNGFFEYVDKTNPFSPLGIFHNPAEGYYIGGEFNANDLLLWSHSPTPSQQSVGEGAMFAFQVPISYAPGEKIAVKELSTRNWQADAAPFIGNEGRTCYVGVSRNEFRGWIGSNGDPLSRFHRTANAKLENSPQRGDPRWLAPQHTPTLLSDESLIFSAFATPTFGALVPPLYPGTDSTLSVLWEIGTSSLISSRAIVSKEDNYVFFTEENGTVHAASTSNGKLLWSMSLMAKTLSEFSMNESKNYLYLADVTGNVVAWRFAGAPTESPSVKPSNIPSGAPSSSSSASPTLSTNPIFDAFIAPSHSPSLSQSPSNFPTPPPTPLGNTGSITPSPTPAVTSDSSCLQHSFINITYLGSTFIMLFLLLEL